MSEKPREFYVPEDFVFNSVDECMDAFPDQAASVLWNHPIKLRAENKRLLRVIAKELTENDELGAEYTYVNALKEENKRLREALKHADTILKKIENDDICGNGNNHCGCAEYYVEMNYEALDEEGQ